MGRLDDITLEELQDLRERTEGEIPRERVLAAIGRKQGDELETLAERHGVVEKTIRNWLDRFATVTASTVGPKRISPHSTESGCSVRSKSGLEKSWSCFSTVLGTSTTEISGSTSVVSARPRLSETVRSRACAETKIVKSISMCGTFRRNYRSLTRWKDVGTDSTNGSSTASSLILRR